MTETHTPQTDPKTGAMPLFYGTPRILVAELHSDLCLNGERDFRFADGANAVPIMAAEFIEAQRAYPIVFVGEPAHPAVVLGLEEGNLFVSADGAWAEDRYIPAYVRRYPFVFIETPDKSQYALGVDIDCERIVAAPDGGEGLAPLFSNGQPTELTQEALRFCAALQANQVATRAFCEALVAQDLLVEQQAQGTFPGGKPFNLQGFHIVDAQRVAGLPDSVVTEWHRNGWLTLIDFHLASLGRWQDLLHRQGAVSPQLAETASPAGAAELADA